MVENKQSIFTSMFKIKLISMVLDKHLKIIVLDMLWIAHCGIAQAGPLNKTFTLINKEPNTENNLINQNHSINVKWEKLQVECLKNCWPTSQEIWRLQVSEDTILTLNGLKKTEKVSILMQIESKHETKDTGFIL